MQKIDALPLPPYITKAATIAEPLRANLIKCPQCVCYFASKAGLAAHADVWHYKPEGKGLRCTEALPQARRRLSH